ncbi:MAG: type II secretion system protein [Candidatus Riflebacteria bacterium]|nr:type II secretion system protein [Candidatus Riflebacteria bacterium]
MANLRKHWRTSDGFTLIEILLVLSIASLMAGYVAPDILGRLHRDRLEDLADRVTFYLRETYQDAVLTGRVRWAVIASGDRLLARDGDGHGPIVDGLQLRSLEIPPWADIEGLEYGWCARPEGYCDEGPLRIRDRTEGRSVTIRFRPYDGEPIGTP